MHKPHKIVGRKVKLVMSGKEAGVAKFRKHPDIHPFGTVFVVRDVWDFCVHSVVVKPVDSKMVPGTYTYHHLQLRYLNNRPVVL